jgi:hypothetical protein
MALFTDGDVSSIEDLHGYDTQLLDVANIEGIDVTRKLELAQEEISAELGSLLGRLNAPPAPDKVVVTGPLKLWHTYLALELVYRDAYRSQLNDRYAGKRDEFHGMVKWAYDKLLQTGLGITDDPIPRAAPPFVQTCTGSLPDATYYVSVTWINAAGGEGTNSVPLAISTIGGSFSVLPIPRPANGNNWNAYVGTSPQLLVLQNEFPIGPNQPWVQPDTIRTSGKQAGGGQAPDYLLPVPRRLQRG